VAGIKSRFTVYYVRLTVFAFLKLFCYTETMDKQLAKLVLSPVFRTVTPEANLVYIILRAEVYEQVTATSLDYYQNGMLVSGLSIQSIGHVSGLSELSVRRLLDELVLRGWLKSVTKTTGDTVYQLGTIKEGLFSWFAEKPEAPAAKPHAVLMPNGRFIPKNSSLRELADKAHKEYLRKKQLEQEATERKLSNAGITGVPTLTPVLKTKIFSEIGVQTDDLKNKLELYRVYRSLFKVKYGCEPVTVVNKPMSVWTQKDFNAHNAAVKLKAENLVLNCGTLEEAKKYLDYAIQNWDELVKYVFPSYVGLGPSFMYLSNVGVISKIRGCMVTGIKPKTKVDYKDLATRGESVDWSQEKAGW
jgi:hypothetical protein